MKNSKNGKMLGLSIFIGAISGTLIGDIVGSKVKALSFLKITYCIGTPKIFTIDLKVLNFTFGINFNVGFMTIIGIILAIMIYRRYQRA